MDLAEEFGRAARAFQAGDFSSISPNGGAGFNTSLGVPTNSLTTDALGRQVFANAIYDPKTRTTAPNGVGIADVFPNNKIPLTRFDPVAAKIQALIPQPTNAALRIRFRARDGRALPIRRRDR